MALFSELELFYFIAWILATPWNVTVNQDMVKDLTMIIFNGSNNSLKLANVFRFTCNWLTLTEILGKCCDYNEKDQVCVLFL